MIIEYITGERLQKLADCTIMSYENDIVKEQIKKIEHPVFHFKPKEDVIYLPEIIEKSKSIFTYTHDIPFFFEKIVPLLKREIILVTHNSDMGIDSSYVTFADNNRIKEWYALNVQTEHSKLIPIPIGIANSQWPHGNLTILDTIRKQNNSKTTYIYNNFDIGTNINERLKATKDLYRNGITFYGKVSYEQYLKEISQSVFNICPPGNGIDTHRMWESLYLRSIPIVIDCPHNRSFIDLPILLVKDYSVVTKEFLKEKEEELINRTINLNKMKLSFWKKQIQD